MHMRVCRLPSRYLFLALLLTVPAVCLFSLSSHFELNSIPSTTPRLATPLHSTQTELNLTPSHDDNDDDGEVLDSWRVRA